MVRTNETYVAGHQQKTFQGFYDTHGPQTTQTVVTALQDNRDTIGPLSSLELSEPTSIGVDRRERREEIMRQAEEHHKGRLEKKKEEDDPVVPSLQLEFLRGAVAIDLCWIEKQEEISVLDWQKSTLKLLVNNSELGSNLRSTVEKMLCEEDNRRKVVRFISKKFIKSSKEMNTDVIFQLTAWFYEIVKELRFREKHGEICDLGDIRTLKKQLLKHVSLPDGVNVIPLEDVYDGLVPLVYSKNELDQLLLRATKITGSNWFILCDNDTAVFNLNSL